MKTILLLAFCLALTTVAVAATDESIDITLKETAHTLSVQGDARMAANSCLTLLRDGSLTPQQAKRVYPMAVRALRELNDRKMIMQAIAACEERQIVCAELRALQSFAVPETVNSKAVQIRDAIEYMWNDIDWRNNEKDFSLFQKYLDEFSERTNISLVTRAQAMLLNKSISYAYLFKLPDPLCEKQYERLLTDLNRTESSVSHLTVYEALQRLYLATKEYLAAGESTMACGGFSVLSEVCYDNSNMSEGDLGAVLCRQILYKLPNMSKSYRCLIKPLFIRIEGHPPKNGMINFRGWHINNQPFGSPKWSIYIAQSPWRETRINIDGSNFYPLPASCKSIKQLVKYVMEKNISVSNTLNRIIFPDNQILWKQVDAGYNNQYINVLTITGHWSKTEINERIEFVSNTLAQISQPLEVLRIYAEKTEKRSQADEINIITERLALQSIAKLSEEEVRELWREFTRIGTKDIVKGKALLKKLKPYIQKKKEIKSSIESLYIKYPESRISVRGRIYDIDGWLMMPATEIHMKRWNLWSYMPEVEDACKVLQTVTSTNNLGAISRRLLPKYIARNITTKDINRFYTAAGFDLKKGLSLDALRTFWDELYAYYNYVILNPEIENIAAYDAFMIEQLIPMFVESARVRPNAFQLPEEIDYEDELTRARIVTAFQEIISYTNIIEKPVFVEKTIKQLVKDLRADANISADENDDEMEGSYADLMRSFLEQGKVDTEKGKELLDMISALPDMPLAGVEFNKLLIVYPDNRAEVYDLLDQFGFISGYKQSQWAIWTCLPHFKKHVKQLLMVDDIAILREGDKGEITPKRIQKIIDNSEYISEIEKTCFDGLILDPSVCSRVKDFHIIYNTMYGCIKDIVELPETAFPNIICANAIEKLIPIYVEIAKNNPEKLKISPTSLPAVREAIDKIKKKKDSPDIGAFVEKTLTELVKKLRHADEIPDATANDKLADSFGESSVKMGVFLIVVDATVQRRNRLDTDYGIMVYRIRKVSRAAKAGIMARDVIVEIGGKKVDGAKTFTRAMNEAYKRDKSAIPITVKRRKKVKQLSVSME